MDTDKANRLAARGWAIGTVAEFLELTADEEAEVEARVRVHLAARTLPDNRPVETMDKGTSDH